jgi:glycosyltransferase involved in cell wall biosynthesis
LKVTISVSGIFDAFFLAEQLEKRGQLDRIFTSYPRFRLRKNWPTSPKVVSLWLPELIARVMSKGFSVLPKLGYYYKALLFDAMVASRLRPCDVFVGFSSSSLRSIKKARSLGAKTLLFRNSSHILSQQSILKEEFESHGLQSDAVYPPIARLEVAEYALTDFIRVPSGYAKRTFLDHGFPERKILELPHGIDLEGFTHAGKADNTFRVVFVGIISLRKGIQYLLEAFRQLALKNAELWLVGGISPDARQVLEKYEGLFKYIGIIPREKLAWYYSQGSVYVLPSLEEGMALTVLEAMACSVPVIVTNHTGVESVVRDGQDGFICPIRDVEAIKQKLILLHDNEPTRQKMGQSANSRASGFTWDWYGDQMEKAMNGILTGKFS